MKITIKILCLFVLIGLILMPRLNAFAEPNNQNMAQEKLELEDPGLLPTSPFYFFKNAFQNVKSALTFNPVKRAQLKMKYANQKILEAKELAKEKNNSEFISKSIEGYQKNIEDISKITQKAKKQIQEQDKDFVNNTLGQILKQNQSLDNIEKNLSKTVKERIRQSREKANQNNAEILSNTANEKTLKKQIQDSIKDQKGDKFKEFKDLAILKRIQNHSPEKIKDIIEESSEYTLSSFKEKLQNMEPEQRKKFDEYVNNAGGNNVTHFQLLKKLEKDSSIELKEQIEKARKRVVKEIENQIQNKENVLNTLQNGDMDNLGTIQELQENIAPGLVEKVMNAKHKALNNFRKKIDQAKTKEERKKIIKEAKENVGINKLQVLNDIKENLPDKDKDFIQQMIKDVNNEIKDKINSAPVNNKEEMIKEMVGSSPEAIETGQKMISDPYLKEKVFKAQIENLKKKIKTSEEPEEIESLKEKIKQNKQIRELVQERAPEIDRDLDQKSEQYMNQVQEKKAKQQLERANKQISDLKKYFQNLKESYPNFEAVIQDTTALKLREETQKRLQEAQVKLENKKYGEAFGIATATMNMANNAYEKLKSLESKSDILKQEIKNTQKENKDMLEDFINSSLLNKKEVKDIQEKINQGKIQEVIKKYQSEINKYFQKQEENKEPGLNQINIESYLKESGLSQEKINKIKEQLNNLPAEVINNIKEMDPSAIFKIANELDLPPSNQREPKQVNDPSQPNGPCVQVITPALKDGVCKNFPTPCDVPQGWQKVDKCPPSVENQTPVQERDRQSEKNDQQEREQEREYEYEIDKTPKQTQEQKENKQNNKNKDKSPSSKKEMRCANFPGPSACPGGIEDIIVVGKDKNGCAIYGCKSSTKSQPKNNKDNNISPTEPRPIKENLEKGKTQSPKAGSTGSLFENIINVFK